MPPPTVVVSRPPEVALSTAVAAEPPAGVASTEVTHQGTRPSRSDGPERQPPKTTQTRFDRGDDIAAETATGLATPPPFRGLAAAGVHVLPTDEGGCALPLIEPRCVTTAPCAGRSSAARGDQLEVERSSTRRYPSADRASPTHSHAPSATRRNCPKTGDGHSRATYRELSPDRSGCHQDSQSSVLCGGCNRGM
ncbi:MAG: hypothetical protein JWP32_2349 [Schumannella sp.]|nr:hypothetical protein [Schumannella sp.]